MENASKALIIAGAILLSILIISLGIMVFNNARESVAGANLDKYQIQEFNQQFTAYVGNNVSGVRINTLLEAVNNSNLAETKEKTGRYVTFSYKASSTATAVDHAVTDDAWTNWTQDFGSGLRYTVEVGTDTKSGLVNKVTVTKN